MRWVTGMPHTARVRQAVLPRTIQLVFAAYESGDFRAAMEMIYAPDVEVEIGALGGEAPPGLPKAVSGREDYVRWVAEWVEGFAWMRWEAKELLDFGDAVVFALHQEGEGTLSGAVTDLVLFSALRFDRGQVAWQAWFDDRDTAIRAVGRDPERVPGP
jgi:hypothetical protein